MSTKETRDRFWGPGNVIVPGVHQAFDLTCGLCSASVSLRSNNMRWLPPEAVRRHFTNKNWFLGRKPAHDMCPDCMSGRRNVFPRQEAPPPDAPQEPETPSHDVWRNSAYKLIERVAAFSADEGFFRDQATYVAVVTTMITTIEAVMAGPFALLDEEHQNIIRGCLAQLDSVPKTQLEPKMQQLPPQHQLERWLEQISRGAAA